VDLHGALEKGRVDRHRDLVDGDFVLGVLAVVNCLRFATRF
jgi:hypothetical protein